MRELVDALLTLARADEGIAPLHKEAVDLRSIVAEAGETGELLAEQAGVRMEVRTPPEPVVVPVDRSRIRQLILNLLTNAVKYTPQGGRVQVQLGQQDAPALPNGHGRVILSVADTGVGIAPSDLPPVFDRFWRADTARTPTGRRAVPGLAASLCQRMTGEHGGAIALCRLPRHGSI